VALQIVSNVDIRAKIRATDYTPTTTGYIVAKRDSVNGEGEWSLGIAGGGNAGKLIMSWYDEIQSPWSGLSTVALGTTDGTDIWVRATREESGTDWNVKFYTSPDGATWTQLGSTVVVSGSGDAIVGNIHPVRIGSLSNQASPFAGRVYNVDVKSGVGGTSVLTIDFTNKTPGATSFAASTGQTITVNGTASIAGTADTPASNLMLATGVA
jgi:hypothetical protein